MLSARQIENSILAKERNGFIYPDYDGLSFYNIIPTIFNLFSFTSERKSLPKEIYKDFINKKNKAVFFLIDGLGFNHYKKNFNKSEFLQLLASNGVVVPITSVFPSTTASCISTFATGLSPQEHGLFEWNLYFKEIDRIIQTLPFSPLGKNSTADSLLNEGISPDILLENETIFQKLGKKGIKSFFFVEESLINSTYSSLISKGAHKIPFIELSDLLVKLKKILISEDTPSLSYVYWGKIDTTEHEYGPYSSQHIFELNNLFENLFNFVKDFNKKDVENIIILLTSDHGQISVDPKNTIYLNKDNELAASFKVLPYGSARDVFLSVKEEEKDETFNYLIQKYGTKAKIFKTKEIIRLGLFGVNKPGNRFLDRVGDVLILPYKNNTIWYEHIRGELFNFLGYHGGLSKEEMIIPFGIARLKNLI